ncbi:thiol reductase thioredoxin [Streptomyces sp. ISL-94]|nr:thiol reductase thioredoxin [Streptomyces sp. ISL-94]
MGGAPSPASLAVYRRKLAELDGLIGRLADVRDQVARQLAAAEEADRLKVVQIDADTNPETVTRYGVLSMPTLLVFRDGEPVRQMVGARAKRKLLQELEEQLARAAGTAATA